MTEYEVFKRDFDNLIGSTTDTLLQSIGEDTLPRALGMAERPRSYFIDAGKKWWKQNRTAIRARLCKSMSVQLYLAHPSNQNKLLIVAAMCDLLAGMLGSISPMTVVALIFHEGMTTLCSDEQE